MSYVLLIGDPRTNSNSIPMKMTYPHPPYDTPSDFYFAELTGNWDLISIGWRKKVLLPIEPLSAGAHTHTMSETIKNNYVIPHGWAYHRVYNDNFGLNPETYPCTEDNVVKAWRSTPFGLVLWCTHGWVKGAVDIMSTEKTPLLDNTRPVHTFQASCENAYPEFVDNLAYSLLLNGAVTTLGATRVSWFTSDLNVPQTIIGMEINYAKKIIAQKKMTSRGNSTTSALLIGENYELRYTWNGKYWQWSSGLIVPDTAWTFVALIVEPEKATLCINDQKAEYAQTHDREEFDEVMMIGWDVNNNQRKFKGNIDEVRVYNRVLKPHEIDSIKNKVDPDLFLLTVHNCSGSGAYPSGSIVLIQAKHPLPGKFFAGWDGDTVGIADGYLAKTTIPMPSHTINLNPVYGNISEYLTLITPNGGETFTKGYIETITWKGKMGKRVKIEYTTQAAVPSGLWSTIVDEVSTTSNAYRWKIPDIPPSQTCRIRIVDVKNNTISVQSSQFFRIVKKITALTSQKKNNPQGRKLQVYPNPVDVQKSPKVTVEFLSPQNIERAQLLIFDCTGATVVSKFLEPFSQSSAKKTVTINLNSQQNRILGGGAYKVILRTEDSQGTQKTYKTLLGIEN